MELFQFFFFFFAVQRILFYFILFYMKYKVVRLFQSTFAQLCL